MAFLKQILVVACFGLGTMPALVFADDVTTASAVNNVTTTASLSTNFDPNTMWRTEDVRPGMKGYGMTVFLGLRPEAFDATVVGVAHNYIDGQDIILCQLKHPLLQDIGVVAGMSGSPVYVNGKLIGAVAYGWSSTIEPLAGVTPIEEMLKVYDATPKNVGDVKAITEETGSRLEAFRNRLSAYCNDAGMTPTPGTINDLQPMKASTSDIPASVRETYNLPETVEMRPLSTPVYVSGFSSNGRALKQLRQSFPNMDFVSVAGGASLPGADADSAPGGPMGDLKKFADEVIGGYALAVPFVEGDASMAGVGTVSWRQGNRLIAFGHPMFGEGPVRAPMAAARILSIVRSSVRPFKLGSSLGQIGMVLEDRRPAIGGLFEAQAPFFSAALSIDDPSYVGKKNFNYRIWANREYGPMILLSVYMEALDTVARMSGDMVLHYDYAMTFDDGTVLECRDGLVSSQLAAAEPLSKASNQMSLIMTNPWKRVLPTNVTMSMRIENKLQQAAVRTMSFDKYQYTPGETVRASITLDPYRQDKQTVETTFAIPADLPPGTYTVNLHDASSRMKLEASRNPALSSPRTYDQLLRTLKMDFPTNQMYLTLEDKNRGMVLRGETLPSLPPTIMSALQSDATANGGASLGGNIVVDTVIPTNCSVSGTMNRTLTVVPPLP